MAALGGRSVGAGPIRSNVAPLHSCVNAPECARGDQKPSLAYVTFTPINLPVFPLLSPPLLASPSPRPPSVRHQSFSLCLLCSLLFASPLLSIQMPHPSFKRPPSGSHHALAFSSLRPFPSIHPSLPPYKKRRTKDAPGRRHSAAHSPARCHSSLFCRTGNKRPELLLTHG